MTNVFKTALKWFLFFVALLPAQISFAQMLANPAQVNGHGRNSFGLGLVNSSIDYEYDHDSGDIKRKTIAFDLGHGVSDKMDAFGQFGFIFDDEAKVFDAGGFSPEGKGFMFGGGVRGLAYRLHQVDLHGYGLFNYTSEEFEDKNGGVKITIKQHIYDFQGGLVGKYQINSDAAVYGGLELVFMSDGKADVKVSGGGTSDSDVERDDKMNLRVGAIFDVSSFAIRPELTLMGEETFMISGYTYL